MPEKIVKELPPLEEIYEDVQTPEGCRYMIHHLTDDLTIPAVEPHTISARATLREPHEILEVQARPEAHLSSKQGLFFVGTYLEAQELLEDLSEYIKPNEEFRLYQVPAEPGYAEKYAEQIAAETLLGEDQEAKILDQVLYFAAPRINPEDGAALVLAGSAEEEVLDFSEVYEKASADIQSLYTFYDESAEAIAEDDAWAKSVIAERDAEERRNREAKKNGKKTKKAAGKK